MPADFETDQDRIEQLEQQVSVLRMAALPRGVRKTSTTYIGSLPLYQIAIGPDPDNDETRGHARAVIAIGDIATGVLAIGGWARGGVALGGLACGLLSFGGCSVGILAGLGGLAIGGIAIGGLAVGLLACGGLALGGVAVGGVAVGHYACGGVAVGSHAINAMQRDPEAVRFFSDWLPWFSMIEPPR